MNVLVDTSVWSLALRRSDPSSNPAVNELRELIRETRAILVGPVRQEILSGIRSDRQYLQLRERLRAFPDVEIQTGDYEIAAQFFNICRTKGVQGSNTDFLLCAVAKNRNIPILTTDNDFVHYKKHIDIKLLSCRK
jgi:predicted nucleic acid-binding protein